MAPAGAQPAFLNFLDLFQNYSGFEGRDWVGMSGSLVEKLNFQAVIKSAASAASRETKNQGPRSRGAHGRRLGLRTTGLGGSPGSWSLIFGLPGGCASSRLDHGLEFYVIQGGCASSRLIHEFSLSSAISKATTLWDFTLHLSLIS